MVNESFWRFKIYLLAFLLRWKRVCRQAQHSKFNHVSCQPVPASLLYERTAQRSQRRFCRFYHRHVRKDMFCRLRTRSRMLYKLGSLRVLTGVQHTRTNTVWAYEMIDGWDGCSSKTSYIVLFLTDRSQIGCGVTGLWTTGMTVGWKKQRVPARGLFSLFTIIGIATQLFLRECHWPRQWIEYQTWRSSIRSCIWNCCNSKWKI